jgi:hypothetical protein
MLLAACASPPAEPSSMHAGRAAIVGSTNGELAGGINLSAIRLEQRDTPPGVCDAAVYGGLAAESGVGLCICQPAEDEQHGEVISRQRCWPDSQ